MITIQFKLKNYKNKPSLVFYRIQGDIKFKKYTHWVVRKDDWLDGDINPNAGPAYNFIRSKIREARNFVEIEVNSKYFNLPPDQLKILIESKINNLPSEIATDTFSSLIAKYAERCDKIGYSKGRVRFFKDIIREIKGFKDPNLDTMNKQTMRIFMEEFMTYLVGKKFANTYIVHFLSAITSAMRFYKTDLVVSVSNIFNPRQFPQKNSEPAYFTTDEIMLLYNHKCGISQKQVLDMLVFCAFTGLRHGELYYVSSDSLKQRGNLWTLERYSPKENNSNVVPLNDICMGVINKYRYIKHNVIFKGKNMNCILPVSNNYYCNKIAHNVMKEIEGPFLENFRYLIHSGVSVREVVIPRWEALTFHSARHHYAFWLRNKGVSMSDISALLNHKALTTTLNIYKHEDSGVIADRTYKLMVGDVHQPKTETN